jgi:hypothetical protein
MLAVVTCSAVTVWVGLGAPCAHASVAAHARGPAHPRLQLIAAQSDLTLIRSHGFVTLDPGIWVAPVWRRPAVAGPAVELHPPDRCDRGRPQRKGT